MILLSEQLPRDWRTGRCSGVKPTAADAERRGGVRTAQIGKAAEDNRRTMPDLLLAVAHPPS